MMRYDVIDAPQRSPEWVAARLGRLTATAAEDMLSTVKSGESAGRRKLRARLVLERLTNRSQESGYVSAAMQQGIDREADAFALYEAQTGRVLLRSGFLSCTDLMAGVSLDAHEPPDGDGRIQRIAEIKSPEDHTHLEYLETGKVPYKYVCQIRHALWVTGAEVCDWFSYNPNFPERMQIALVPVKACALDIPEYDRLARAFLAEVDLKHKSLLGWQAVA